MNEQIDSRAPEETRNAGVLASNCRVNNSMYEVSPQRNTYRLQQYFLQLHPYVRLLCRTQAIFSIGTVILFVTDSYYWETSYVALSMKLEVCVGWDYCMNVLCTDSDALK